MRGNAGMQKRILIINTGGTLSSVKGCNGLVPGMSSGDMLEELRMVSRNLELEAEGQFQYRTGRLDRACETDRKEKL